MNRQLSAPHPSSAGLIMTKMSIESFEQAIELAASKNIILLCLAGGYSSFQVAGYPGEGGQCIRIGADFRTSNGSPLFDEDEVDFFFPYADANTISAFFPPIEILSNPSADESDVRNHTGSIAMGAAAALVANLIYCARLLTGSESASFESRHALMKAFKRISVVDKKTISVRYLEAQLKAMLLQQGEESSDVAAVPWNDNSRLALKSLLYELQD